MAAVVVQIPAVAGHRPHFADAVVGIAAVVVQNSAVVVQSYSVAVLAVD